MWQFIYTKRLALSVVALTALGACDENFDLDFRDLGGGNSLDTSAAVLNLPDRPRPDVNGVITYPTYQVVVARRDDTPVTVAGRIGIDAQALADYNAISTDTVLRAGEVLAVPNGTTGTIGGTLATDQVDVTTLASNAIDRATPQQTAPATSTQTTSTIGPEPIRHQVKRGETAYSIARLYNLPVRTIAEWNGLGADLAVREDQYLLIPQVSTPEPVSNEVSAPGEGSTISTPPSASEPLPDNDTTTASAAQAQTPPVESPDLGVVDDVSDAPFVYPVRGAIIRAYAPGRNDGIDISVDAGTEVVAAGAGTVAAVTTDTNGVAIVVIRHANNLLTVYTNLESLTVGKDASVSQGQVIGRVKAGNPSFVHFEVRNGLQSVDPTDYLP
jgi:murein DD-endopeptidase MepM/ murein hydrolase activator NlpD